MKEISQNPVDIPDGPTDIDTKVMINTFSVIPNQIEKVLHMPLCVAFIDNKGSTLQSNSPGVDVFVRLVTDYNIYLAGSCESTTQGEEIS